MLFLSFDMGPAIKCAQLPQIIDNNFTDFELLDFYRETACPMVISK
jgi:hypothetical protein